MMQYATIFLGSLAFFFSAHVASGQDAASAPLQLGDEANGKTVEVKGVSRVLIRLPGNITTGFSWAVARVEGAAVKAAGEVQYVSAKQAPGMVGGGGTFEASFEVVAAGKATVTMEYRRSWEKDQPAAKTFTVMLDVQGVQGK